MGPIRELALSFPTKWSTIARANSKAVPGPRLVISCSATTTRFSRYLYSPEIGEFTIYLFKFLEQ